MKKNLPTTSSKPNTVTKQPTKPKNEVPAGKPILNKPIPAKKAPLSDNKPPVSKTVVLNEEFINEAVEAHNFLRRKHGVPIVKHNPELSKIAQKYAETLAQKDSFEHSKNMFNGNSIGENLAMCFGREMKGQYMTQMWYDEIKNYNFSKPGYVKGIGHFTQVVWKGSQEVGFGVAKSLKGNYYSVGNYFPAGNYMGAFESNVFPLVSEEEVKKDKEALDKKNEDDKQQKNMKKEGFEEKKAESKIEKVPKKQEDSLNSVFINEAIAKHNFYRKLHNAPDLIHNPELSKIAQSWAEHIVATNSFEHSDNTYNKEPIGENLAMCGGVKMTGESMTNMWYNEVKSYSFAKPGFGMKTGHFTQVVWKGTKEAGFGLSVTKSGEYYAVGNYYPSGNYEGQFKENVLPSKK